MIDRDAVVAIFLAAGRSTRFGADDKLLAPLGGVPLLLHAAQAIVDLAPARRIAVCPDRNGPVAALLADRGFDIVANPCPERGLSQSLRLGIGAVSPGVERAALLCLADMPFVRAGHLAALLARFDPDATACRCRPRCSRGRGSRRLRRQAATRGGAPCWPRLRSSPHPPDS